MSFGSTKHSWKPLPNCSVFKSTRALKPFPSFTSAKKKTGKQRFRVYPFILVTERCTLHARRTKNRFRVFVFAHFMTDDTNKVACQRRVGVDGSVSSDDSKDDDNNGNGDRPQDCRIRHVRAGQTQHRSQAGLFGQTKRCHKRKNEKNNRLTVQTIQF